MAGGGFIINPCESCPFPAGQSESSSPVRVMSEYSGHAVLQINDQDEATEDMLSDEQVNVPLYDLTNVSIYEDSTTTLSKWLIMIKTKFIILELNIFFFAIFPAIRGL